MDPQFSSNHWWFFLCTFCSLPFLKWLGIECLIIGAIGTLASFCGFVGDYFSSKVDPSTNALALLLASILITSFGILNKDISHKRSICFINVLTGVAVVTAIFAIDNEKRAAFWNRISCGSTAFSWLVNIYVLRCDIWSVLMKIKLRRSIARGEQEDYVKQIVRDVFADRWPNHVDASEYIVKGVPDYLIGKKWCFKKYICDTFRRYRYCHWYRVRLGAKQEKMLLTHFDT